MVGGESSLVRRLTDGSFVSFFVVLQRIIFVYATGIFDPV